MVSIIIPLHNSEAFIKETIQSCLNQSYSNIEVIVVENGSSDKSYELVKSIKDERIQLYKTDIANASAARNLGHQKATGEYILFLDADDLLSTDKITLQMKALSTKPEGWIASCAWAKFKKHINEAQVVPQEVWYIENPIDWCISAMTGGGMMIPGCWLIPQSVIKQAGPWDKSLSLHDDGEFMCRVLLASKGNVFVDDAIVYYRHVPNSLSKQNKSLKAVESALKVCKSYEENSLVVNNSIEVRTALAYNYSRFIYEFHPHHKALIKQAKAHIKSLRVPTPIVGGHQFKKLSRLIGFYNAIRIREITRRFKG
tara:strand:+ start:21225 stop:22163 length:939 start_codon:yes stop_codon:yes gene_type:complete